MRTDDIVGKTVALVIQDRTQTTAGVTVYDTQQIIFTDGTKIILTVAELPDDYAVKVLYVKPK